MIEVIHYIPTLAVAIIINIALGLYYNIGVNKFEFDWKILVAGVIKAVIIAGSFIGLGFCFEQMDLSSIGMTPVTIISAAIILYVTKGCITLSKILGVENAVKK